MRGRGGVVKICGFLSLTPESPERGSGARPGLKLQYFDHLMRRGNSLEKTLMLGKTEGRRSEWQRMVR